MSLVQSGNTGNFYAMLKYWSIPSKFDGETAKSMVGAQVPGGIKRTMFELYMFAVQNVGDVVMLDYCWAFFAEAASIEDAIYEGTSEIVQAEKEESIFLKELNILNGIRCGALSI